MAGGASSTKLASTVSNLGGMGSYGMNHLTAPEIIEVNREIRTKTSKPYALNLWVSNKDEHADEYSIEEYKKLCSLFKPWFDELSIPLPGKPGADGRRFEDQVQAVIDAQLPVVTHITKHRFFLMYAIIGVALTVGIYFLNRWYVNKLYGQHIQKLKELLLQMDEADES